MAGAQHPAGAKAEVALRYSVLALIENGLQPGMALVWDTQRTGDALTVVPFKDTGRGLMPVNIAVGRALELGVIDSEGVAVLRRMAADDPSRCDAILSALADFSAGIGAGPGLLQDFGASIRGAIRRFFLAGETKRQESLRITADAVREALAGGRILNPTNSSEGAPLKAREFSGGYLREVGSASRVLTEVGLLKPTAIERLKTMAADEPNRCQVTLRALEKFGGRIKERQRIIQRVANFTEDPEIAALVERAQGVLLAPTADPDVFSGLGQVVSLLESIEARSPVCVCRFPNGFKEQLKALPLSKRAKLVDSVEGAIRNYDEWIRPSFEACDGFAGYLQKLEGALTGFEGIMADPAYCRREDGAKFIASVRGDLAELARCPRREDIPTPTTAQELLDLEQHFHTKVKVDEGISALLEAEHRARTIK